MERLKYFRLRGRAFSLINKFASVLVILLAVAAGTAKAQTTIQFASGVTSPQGGVILTGTGINPATGQPVRHLWTADADTGVCRLDADIDTPGLHRINPATCLKNLAGGIVLQPGQLAFDPAANELYVLDLSANSLGVFRLHFLPGGDGGQGGLDPARQEVLGGITTTGRRADTCGIGANLPISLSFGPDSNLYVGFKRSGSVMRITFPHTEPLPCGNVQADIGATPDLRSATGLAWIGHDLFSMDTRTPVIFLNGDQCFTPQNGFISCPGHVAFVLAFPPAILASDQVYPGLSGKNVYYGGTTSVTQFTVQNSTTLADYGGNFSSVSALAVDATNPANPVLYVGDDPSVGAVAGQGRWFQISSAPPAPAPPGIPSGVTATAGDSVATVSWMAGQNGQPISSYTVHNSFASNGAPVADITVNPVAGSTIAPTSVAVMGLTNGVSYQFEVLATNAFGSSAFSAPSNTVTPQAVTVPGAPTGVSASASNASALVAWTPPASNGGSAITAYTVTALTGGAPTLITVTVPASSTGVVVAGLTNGTTYTFTVHATNALGNSAESAPSNAVTPTPPPPPPPGPADLVVTMVGPSAVDFGANAVYAVTVANIGQSPAPQVVLTDNLPVTGATLIGSAPSQGSCALSGSTLTCSLGSIAPGSSATITVTVNLLAQGVNNASAQASDAAGNLLVDPTPANNSASVTTGINGVRTTTDIQVTGSAQNGGPTAGQADNFTWQIKNGGNQVANNVVFTNTLPAMLIFASAHSSVGSCTAPTAGSTGGTITCSVDSLGVGQTMVVTVAVVVPKAGSSTSQGSATFNGTDTNLANNSFSVVVQAKQ